MYTTNIYPYGNKWTHRGCTLSNLRLKTVKAGNKQTVVEYLYQMLPTAMPIYKKLQEYIYSRIYWVYSPSFLDINPAILS